MLLGVENPKPGYWYNQQYWLNAFKMIYENIGPKTLYAIGLKIPETAVWPPEIDSIEKALASIDVAYHLNHRLNQKILYNSETKKMEEGIGHYHFELVSPRKAKMFCDNPYPCDFDKGIITCIARKFQPPDSKFVFVSHDDSLPCRNKGADSCTYWVEW